MDRFVLGFAFTENRSLVLLVSKLRPEWQKGLLNGIGGSIERKESPIEAMNRECMEEAGLVLKWKRKGQMGGINNNGYVFSCDIFYAFSSGITLFRQKEDELLDLYVVKNLKNLKTVANLQFLIPYGVCKDGSEFIKIDYI